LNRLIVPPEISLSERRPLATFPAFSASAVFSARFMGDFESYAADSFAFRDGLREARALTVFRIFRQTDKNGLYYGASGAGKFEKIDESSAALAAAKIARMAASLTGQKLYYSFVPDKSIYAGRQLPGFDAGEAERILAEPLRGLTYIRLTEALAAADFYRTDLHWDQSRLAGVLAALGQAMDFTPALPSEPLTDLALRRPGEFSGVYAGQLALPLPPDEMTYWDGAALEELRVSYLEPGSGQFTAGPVYDLAGFAGRDPYDLFLRGPQPLIVIENPAAANQRQLYLFRDSFGSSLAPLLALSYARVTLIDLRYLDSRALPLYVDFAPGADVLFLYSSQILNNATTLLVSDSL
jgi:hypothetical protein